ncbi:HTTM domain-containing protein [Lysinibacter sp. HNR]|uniref:HTTM domain-containing protein n=1 Tax=Lysinibacter sp. HNR TaxID=3031408 RepID=UPI002434EF7C|nr:HTTM domain-containing protein [Lysinibacter sp. HNR]WGD37149.1 HTTM domain-containing protein [Lysinibacter sp. HNR]
MRYIISGFMLWMTANRHGTRTLAIVRIGFGAIVVAFLLVNLPVRDKIWGSGSNYSWELFLAESRESREPSLFALSGAEGWGITLYFALLVVALLFVLGLGGRATTVCFYVLLWSLQIRNPYVINGGDNLMRILVFYLVFAQVTARYSLDSLIRRRWFSRNGRVGRKTSLGTVAHNTALIACVTQVCFLYFASGLYKVQGEKWQNGTALYYVLRTAEYNTWPELTSLIYQSPIVVVAATYGVVFAQLFLPFVLVSRLLKIILLPMVMAMHVCIGIFMGLPFFSGIMIVSDLFLLGDRDLQAIYVRFRLLRVWIRTRMFFSKKSLPVYASGE